MEKYPDRKLFQSPVFDGDIETAVADIAAGLGLPADSPSVQLVRKRIADLVKLEAKEAIRLARAACQRHFRAPDDHDPYRAYAQSLLEAAEKLFEAEFGKLISGTEQDLSK